LKKKERHQLIQRIISQNRISTQEELLEILCKQSIKTTQATLSRDIRELNLLKKRDDDGRVVYVLPHFLQNSEYKLQKIVQDSLQSIEQVQFLLILRTHLGDANVIAAFIDELSLNKVAGTLAGANTLMIVAYSVEDASELKKKIEKWIV
jgi:transcriptional regulator of arginine metabolism